MRLVLIAYNEAIDEDVMEVLKASSVECYTKWVKVLGNGRSSGPHMATPVWPKANNFLMIAAEDEKASNLLEGMRNLRKSLRHEGVKAFMIPLEAVT